jgi:hypothetical protein
MAFAVKERASTNRDAGSPSWVESVSSLMQNAAVRLRDADTVGNLPHCRLRTQPRPNVGSGRVPVSLCESTNGRCSLKPAVDVLLGRPAATGCGLGFQFV